MEKPHMIYQPIPIGRVCKLCGEWKPRALLQKNKQSPDGITNRCKYCDNRDSAARYWANREKRMAVSRQYRLEHQEELRAYDRARGKTEHRREQDRKRNRIRRSNPEYRAKRRAYQSTDKWRKFFNEYQKRPKSRDYMKLYRREHPEQQRAAKLRRRAKEKMLPTNFSPADFIRMMEYFDHCCVTCGRSRGFWVSLAADHWIPVNNPNCPGTVVENMIPLCQGANGCNNSKSDLDPVEWLIKRFGERKAKKILKRIQDYFEWVKLQT